MITYVNTVFVSNSNEAALGTVANNGTISLKKGQFIIVDENNKVVNANNAKDARRIKIGMGTGSKIVDPKTGLKTIDQIKWSNIINVADIKSYNVLANYVADTEDRVYINFNGLDGQIKTKFAEGGKRIIVRLTFKDLPTRFRKWTESYEYVTKANDNEASIAAGIAELINKQWKRARVIAKVGNFANDSFTEAANGKVVEIEAMPYDDDDSVDTINWANKVRFNVNLYYTDPAADGWESLNKHYPVGVVIVKKPGFQYAASAKLVRDREAQAMGYDGILNRGEGTWPIIKPAMNTDLNAQYKAFTIEFENMYRAADDIFRKTKQAVEIYCSGSQWDALQAVLGAVATQSYAAAGRITVDAMTEDGEE